MKIIKAKYIIICNDEFEILKEKSIVFNDKIVGIYPHEEAILKFENAKIYDFSDSIIMPAFINSHCHLEYSSNKTTLVYGDFLKWLKSVIQNRDEISNSSYEKLILEKIKLMQKSGVGTIAEISSFGKDIEICAKSDARIILFNEALGSNENLLNQNLDNFHQRFQQCKNLKNDLFIPALSIHSPYSTHPKIAKELCKIAKDENLLMTTHFLESNHEKRWLEKQNGDFKKWMLNFNKNPKPMYTIDEFLSLFKDIKTLFVHCVYADFKKFDKNLHSISHCLVSNRLLSKKKLNLKKLQKLDLNFCIGTDGLSSNISLNFFDELRANLLSHDEIDLIKLSKMLILASTKNAAKALNLDLGILQKDKIADIAVYNCFDIKDINQLPLQLLLQTKEVKKLFIKGEECKL